MSAGLRMLFGKSIQVNYFCQILCGGYLLIPISLGGRICHPQNLIGPMDKKNGGQEGQDIGQGFSHGLQEDEAGNTCTDKPGRP